MAAWLEAEIAKSFQPPWNAVTERDVFGDWTPEEIVDAISRACLTEFGSRLDDGFMYVVSVGCVVGCRLVDGREVVLKGFQRRWSSAFLAAVKRTQAHLHGLGFPCPEPIGSPLSVGHGVVLAERVLADPGPTVPTAETMRQSAVMLVRLVQACAVLDEPALALNPSRQPHEGLFPPPHSLIFDFDATSEGAEWIDEIAKGARAVRDADTSTPVIAHTDWSLRNVRFARDEVVAIYDWDSLALSPESRVVGEAAAGWCKTGEGNDSSPTNDEIGDYIAHYESVRGTPLTPVQRRAANAAAVYGMAYTARCEHAVDPDSRRYTTTRVRLRDDAPALVS